LNWVQGQAYFLSVEFSLKAQVHEVLTLLLHKGVVESAAYHHKRAVPAALMIPFKGHYWVDPVVQIDLTAVPLWLRV
jgi:hypothetical protein